jgi:hypothetical protein
VTAFAAEVAAEAGRMREQFEADTLAAELGCEVTPHPGWSGVVEARDPAPGLWLLTGTPDEVRAEARRCGLLQWLAVLGTQGQR